MIITAADEGTLRRADGELRNVRCVMRKPLDIVELSDELERCVRLATDGKSAAPSRELPPAAGNRAH